MEPTKNVTWKARPVTIGRIKYGSETVRSFSHSRPPLSRPGTGRAAMPRRSLKVPNPRGTCSIGTKTLHVWTLADLKTPRSSTVIRLISSVSLAAWAILRRALMGAMSGFMVAIRAETSAALMYALRSTRRTNNAVRIIEPHHGVPLYT